MTIAARGRPPKLCRRVIRDLAKALEVGNYVSTACALAGIHKSTFYEWLAAAEAPDAIPLLREFSDATRRALAAGEARDVAVIDKAAQRGSWQAAAWRLERKFPQRWRVDVRQHITRELDMAIDRICVQLGPERAEEVLVAIMQSPDDVGRDREEVSVAPVARQFGELP